MARTMPHLASAPPRRLAAFALVLAASALGAAAGAPPLFAVLADSLDADAPAASLPASPVVQALADLAREQPKARVLVPLQTGERQGQRYALAAWQSTTGASEWDALLVVATAAGARTVEVSSTHPDRAAALEALIAFGTSGGAQPAVAGKAVAATLATGATLLPLPSQWDQRFVVLLSRNPVYRPGDAAAEAALTEAHIQYTLKLQQAGTALAAGPFDAAATGPGAPIGMTLLRVRDLAAAERIAAQDPAVVAGRLVATVREWTVPAGKLP
jgi:hypothetical protein